MGGSGGAAATGDPHLQNVFGQRFDLMKPGKHVLINIPRGRRTEAMLRVEAEVRQLGGHCADMYFEELNITGAWVEAKGTSGLRFRAQVRPTNIRIGYSLGQSNSKSPMGVLIKGPRT